MLNTATKSEAPGTEQELTDGFHLVIDALKLNGIKTIYNVPGIPITDLGRMAQAEGIRMISFRHEQNAGYAAGIAGYFMAKAKNRTDVDLMVEQSPLIELSIPGYTAAA